MPCGGGIAATPRRDREGSRFVAAEREIAIPGNVAFATVGVGQHHVLFGRSGLVQQQLILGKEFMRDREKRPMTTDSKQVRVEAQRTFIALLDFFQQVAQAQDGIHHPPGFAFHRLDVVGRFGFGLAFGERDFVLHVHSCWSLNSILP